MTKATHGGPGRGQGRKPLPDEERTIVVTVRLTPARREKLRRLGAHWLAKAVDRAMEPMQPNAQIEPPSRLFAAALRRRKVIDMDATPIAQCPTCSEPMEMYYKPWCPRCEKPKLGSIQTLNILQALRHLEVLGNHGIKDRIWKAVCEYAPIKNDTYFTMVFPVDADDAWSEEHYTDLMTLKREFELGDSIVMEVSW